MSTESVNNALLPAETGALLILSWSTLTSRVNFRTAKHLLSLAIETVLGKQRGGTHSQGWEEALSSRPTSLPFKGDCNASPYTPWGHWKG